MAKVDARKIEAAAVTAIRAMFSRAKRIDVHIEVNDKTPCVDGDLQIYNTEEMAKENLKGIIKIQIKGTTSKLNADTPRRTVSVADLRAYLEVYGGVLYFVVALSSDLEVEGVYCKQLLPYDLKNLFETKIKSNQKTVTLGFHKLPAEPDALEKLCDEMLSNQKRQQRAKYVNFGSLDEFQANGIAVREVQFGTIIADTPTANSLKSWSNGTYQYAIAEDGQEYVFSRMEPPVGIATGAIRSIRADDIEEYCMVFSGEDLTSLFLEFGSFKIRFGDRATIEYTPTGTFRERLRDAKLMRGILRSGEMFVEGAGLSIGASCDESELNEINDQIVLYQSVVDVMDELGVKTDWYPEKLTKSEDYQIRKLIDALIKHKHVPIKGASSTAVNLNVDIQGARVKIFAKKHEDGLYEFFDPFSDTLVFAVGVNADESLKNPLSGFLALNQEDYQLSACIDSERFIRSLRRFPINEFTSAFACNKLLDMLRAYDCGAVCGDDLIECASVLANHLLAFEPESAVNFINKAQVLRRKGKLSSGDKRELRNLSKQHDDPAVQLCAYLLLDLQEYAKDIIEDADEEHRTEYKNWPIMRFYGEGL